MELFLQKVVSVGLKYTCNTNRKKKKRSKSCMLLLILIACTLLLLVWMHCKCDVLAASKFVEMMQIALPEVAGLLESRILQGP